MSHSWDRNLYMFLPTSNLIVQIFAFQLTYQPTTGNQLELPPNNEGELLLLLLLRDFTSRQTFPLHFTERRRQWLYSEDNERRWRLDSVGIKSNTRGQNISLKQTFPMSETNGKNENNIFYGIWGINDKHLIWRLVWRSVLGHVWVYPPRLPLLLGWSRGVVADPPRRSKSNPWGL